MTNFVPSTEFEPKRLLERARQGSRDAVGQLLERYRNYLELIARIELDRRLQGKFDASDAVQETFLDAHRDFAQFRGTTEAELMAWLRRLLACNLTDVVRHYSAKQRDAGLERSLGEELDRSSQALCRGFAATHSTPSQHAARRERAVILANALARLPEHYREVIILHHFESLPVPAVADRLGRSVASVEKLWVRGLVQMRREIGAEP